MGILRLFLGPGYRDDRQDVCPQCDTNPVPIGSTRCPECVDDNAKD